MKIGAKLMTGYALMASLTIVAGGAGLLVAKQIRDTYVLSAEGTLTVIQSLEMLRYAGARMNGITGESIMLRHLSTKSGVVVGSAAGLDEATKRLIVETLEHEQKEMLEGAVEPSKAGLAKYERLVNAYFPDKRETLAQLQAISLALMAQSEKLIQMAQAPVPITGFLAALKELEEIEENFFAIIDEALVREQQELIEHREAIQAATTHGMIASGLITLSAFLIAILFGLFHSRSIAKPIEQLGKVANQFGQNNLRARANIDSKDEIGQLGQDLNQMAQQLSKTTISQSYLNNVINSIPDALFVVDENHVISRTNPVAIALLGYSKSELLGRDLTTLLSDESSSLLLEVEHDGYNVTSDVEMTYQTKEGKAVPVSTAIAPLSRHDTTEQETVIIAKDISERKYMEAALLQETEALERSNQELNQFAYVASHDLKAPLRAIANLSQWIEEDLEEELGASLNQNTCRQMDLLRGRIHRMEALINGLLEYSRVGRMALEVERVDTAELLADCIDSLPVPPEFQIEIGENMPVVEAPRLCLTQVFTNLISNAIKHHPRSDGRVAITVRDTGNFHKFTVADDGMGIDPKYHEKIFTIFQTLATRDQVEGTGIGLSLVKKTIETHGGTIFLESTAGNGARFCFTWPIEMSPT